jgi:hypothetical protein
MNQLTQVGSKVIFIHILKIHFGRNTSWKAVQVLWCTGEDDVSEIFVFATPVLLFHPSCDHTQNISRMAWAWGGPNWDLSTEYILIAIIWDTIVLTHWMNINCKAVYCKALWENTIWRILLSTTTPINHANYLSPCNIYDNATNDIVLIAAISHLFWGCDTYIR